MKVTFSFLWFDAWIGFFYDQKRRILYICPLPCCVIKVEGRPPVTSEADAARIKARWSK